jgi:hypothetical protein
LKEMTTTVDEKEQNTGGIGFETDEPLLVLRYEPWRIIWRLFFPYSIVMPIFCLIAFHWAPSRPASFMIIVSQVVGVSVLAGGFWLMTDMLLMKDFRLYRNRIVKTYWLLGRREVLLEKADIVIANKLSKQIVFVYERGNYLRRLTKRAYFDFNIASNESLKSFLNACRQIHYEFDKNRDGLIGIKIEND